MCDYYVLDIYPCTKFCCSIISGGFSAHMSNITLLCLFWLSCPVWLFLFSGTRPGRTPGWIFTVDGLNDAFSPKYVPFGGQNNESYILGVRLRAPKIHQKVGVVWHFTIHAKWQNTKIAIYPKVIKIPKSNLNSISSEHLGDFVCGPELQIVMSRDLAGRHLENLWNVITSPNMVRFAWNLVCRHILPL